MAIIQDARRREVKYRISMFSALSAIHRMSALLTADKHNSGSLGYMVRSLYFDSIYNDDLEQKEDGLEWRKKIRLRVYSPSDTTAKLELKEKDGDWQRKRSLSISKEQALMLINRDYSALLSLDNELAEELYLTMTKELYLPRVMVQYDRAAFVVPANDTRITFDMRLCASEGCYDLFGDRLALYPIGYYDDTTLEVKYNHFLMSYVKDLLDNIEKTPVAYSKYVMARAISHQPD